MLSYTVDIGENSYTVDSETPLTTDEIMGHLSETVDPSSLGSAARSALRAFPSMSAGVIAAGAAQPIIGPIAAATGPAAPITEAVLSLGTGLAATLAARKLQDNAADAFIPKGTQGLDMFRSEEAARDYETNPNASMVGELLAGGTPSFSNIIRSGKLLSSISNSEAQPIVREAWEALQKGAINEFIESASSPIEKAIRNEALDNINSALQVGIGTGISGGQSIAQGRSAEDTLKEMASGALFTGKSPFHIGSDLFRPTSEKSPTPEMPTAFEPARLNEQMRVAKDSIVAEETAKQTEHAANVDRDVQQASAITEQVLVDPKMPEVAKEALIAGQQQMSENARTKVQQFALERQTEAQKRFDEMFPEQVREEPVVEPEVRQIEPEVRQAEPIIEPEIIAQEPIIEPEPTIPNENQNIIPVREPEQINNQQENRPSETSRTIEKEVREEVAPKDIEEAWAESKDFLDAENAVLRGNLDEADLIETQFRENYAKATPEPVARPETKPAENAVKESRKVSPKPEPEPIRSEQAAERVGEEVTTKPSEISNTLADDFTESLNRSSEEAPAAATLKTPTRGDIPVEIVGKEGNNFIYRNEQTGDTGRIAPKDIGDLTAREATPKKLARSKKIVAEKKAEEAKVEEVDNRRRYFLEASKNGEIVSDATKPLTHSEAVTMKSKFSNPNDIRLVDVTNKEPTSPSTKSPSEVFTDELLKDIPEKARSKWTPEDIQTAQKAVGGDVNAFDSLPQIKQNAVARFIAEQGISVDYIKQNGAKNKLVDWADNVLKESKKNFNLSVNPQLFAAYAIKGAELVTKGFTTFKAWSNRMLSKFGQGIKSYLNDLWAVAQSKKGALDIGGGKKPEGEPTPEPEIKAASKPEPEAKGPWAGKEPEVKPPDNPIEQPKVERINDFSALVRDVDAQRKAQNQPELPANEKANVKQAMDEAADTLKANPNAGKELIASLIETPRTPSLKEAAIVSIELAKLKNTRRENYKIIDDSLSSQEHVKEAYLRNALLQDEIDVVERANDIMRNQWGGMGNFLQQQVKEDYSLEALVRKRTTEKLGDAPKGEELKQIEEQAEAIRKLQTENDKLNKEKEEFLKSQDADAAFKELQKSVVRRKARGEGLDTDEKIQKEFAHVKDVNEVPSQSKMELLARFHIENGVRNIEDLTKALRKDLKDNHGYREFTDSEIHTALSGYGKPNESTRSEVDKIVTDLKSQAGFLEKIKQAGDKIIPYLNSIREKMTPEQRRLAKELEDKIDEMKLNKKGEDTRSSRLDKLKSRLNNLIQDLDKDIADLKKGKTINNHIRTAVERDTTADRLQGIVDKLRKDKSELQPKKELTEEQWNKNMIAVAKRMQAEFERRLAEKDFAVKKRPEHKASVELEKARAERDAAKEEMKVDEDYKKSAEERAIATILRRKQKQIERYEERIANKDFEPKPRKPAPQDKRIDELDLEILRVKNEFMKDQENARRANRTKWQKLWDGFPETKRAMVLSSPAVIGKLGAAGFVRNVMSGAEEIVGKGLERIIPKAVLDKATLEGKADIGALATGVKEGYSKWGKDIKDIYKIGKTDLDLKYGDKKTYDENGLGTWFGRMHYIMKAPAKRAAFRSASIRLTKRYAAEGADVTSDVMQAKIGTEAYKHAQNAIFMGENAIGRAFNAGINFLERDKGDVAPGIARVLKTLFPIVKVPLNIANESFVTAFGGVTGAAKLVQVYRRGVDAEGKWKLSEDEANMIVRHFKKGSIGAGAMLLGFLAKDSVGGFYEDKEKRKLGEIGARKFRIAGVDIPSWLAHAPIFEVMQMGATLRRTMEKENEKGEPAGFVGGLPAGLMASIIGVAEETPFMNEMFRTKELQSPEGREKFLAELAKSQLEPLLLQQVAAQMDKTPLGETVKRNPKGTIETMMSGIPGLRNQLAVKITDALPPSEIGHIPEPIKKYAMAGGLMPSKPEKGVLLHKNPQMTDEQFAQYAEIRGKFIKDALLRSVSRLSRLDEDKQRNAIRTISQNASDAAKRKLRLRV